MEIVHSLCRKEGVGIQCTLILGWIKLTADRIISSAQHKTKSEILLGEVIQKQQRVIRQPASLLLDYSIVTSSRVFSPGLSTLDPTTLSPKIPQPKSRSEHNYFTRLFAY